MEQRTIPTYKNLLIWMVCRLGRLYAIGPKNSGEGVEVCRVLHGHGVPSTLGRFSRMGDDPLQIVREYQQASDYMKNASGKSRFYLSIKPQILEFDLDLVAAIAATALRNGHGIHFDSHGHSLAEPTIRLLGRLMDRHPWASDLEREWRYGMTLQSRWKRSMEDARWAAGKRVRVRLVKGEFKAPGSRQETDPRKGFLALIELLAGAVPEIAVATHDHVLARDAVARCRAAGSAVLLELLFGMPVGNMMALARELGVPVGFYVPYGDALLPYGVRHFLTHPHKLLRPGLQEVVAGHRAKLARTVESLGEELGRAQEESCPVTSRPLT